MKFEVMRLIIQVTVVNWIINLTVVQFNMSYTLKTYQHINTSTRSLHFRDQDKSS